MKSLYYTLFLADELKPLIFDDYYMTSLGRVYFNDESKSQCFILNPLKLNGGCYLYDSSYDIYEANLKYNEIKKTKNKYEINQIGYLNIVEDNDDYIEFIVNEDQLYIFNKSNNYNDLLSYLIYKFRINYVYSKSKIFENYEVIRFAFPHAKMSTDFFLLEEAQRCGLIGDYIDNQNFKMGCFKYDLDSNMPLLMWPRDNLKYENKLVETNYYEFKEEIKCIKEFKFEENELEIIKSNHGKFFFLKDKKKIIGYVSFGMVFDTFIYVSNLAIKEEYRKMGYGKILLDSLKELGNKEKKNLILTIEDPNVLRFYEKNKFKNIGMLRFK